MHTATSSKERNLQKDKHSGGFEHSGKEVIRSEPKPQTHGWTHSDREWDPTRTGKDPLRPESVIPFRPGPGPLRPGTEDLTDSTHPTTMSRREWNGEKEFFMPWHGKAWVHQRLITTRSFHHVIP